MKYLLVLGLFILIIQQSIAPPVTKKKDGHEDDEDLEIKLEYERYLTEVVEVLEGDPEFKAKLQNASEVDIKSGKIAHELEFMNNNVRTKLDEIKRREIERLRHLATKEMEIENSLDRKHLKIPEHLDHENVHSFEIDDLKKLIAKTTKDLAMVDQKRKEEFKEYEMQKKFEQEQKLKGNGTEMDEEARKKYEDEIHKLEEKHKKHDPLHHPGSKQQLEEVWEKEDHMDSEKFDPKTFFYMHDLDGNGFWDPNEVKALFRKELDKLYEAGHPEDDLIERAEEMERMREHVFNEADLNKDGLINYHEFLEQTNKPAFKQDEGWKPLDEQQIYSQQEYEEFEKRRQEDIQRLIAQGVLPPHQNANGHPQQFQPQYGHPPPQGMPNPQVPSHGQPAQQPQYQHPPQYQGQVPQHQMQGQMQQQYQQVPQQYHGQVPQQVSGQVYHPNQIPQQGHVPHQQYQGQVPQQQYQGQPPQQQYQGQPPPQQYQGQPPPQQYQGQPPQQQYQGQPPQQQQYQGQIPQQQQGQVPQQQQPQGNIPQQLQQVPVPVNQQPQGQQAQQNPSVAQPAGNVPVSNSIPEVKKV